MKSILMTLTLFVGSIAFAGNGSGTLGGRPVAKLAELNLSAEEVVLHLGEKDGVVRFQYGHLNGQQWDIQDVEISKTEIIEQPEVVKALEKSRLLKNWAEIVNK